MDEQTNHIWAVVNLMGHQQCSGKLTKPTEYGGLFQLDIPVGEKFRTKFFASGSVYDIDVVSEEIARAYALRADRAIVAYDTPIITREQHQTVVGQLESSNRSLVYQVDELKRRLTSVNRLLAPADDDERAELVNPF